MPDPLPLSHVSECHHHLPHYINQEPCFAISLPIIWHISDTLASPTASSYKMSFKPICFAPFLGPFHWVKTSPLPWSTTTCSSWFFCVYSCLFPVKFIIWRHEFDHVLPQTLNPSILSSSFKMRYKMLVKTWKTLNNMATSFFITLIWLCPSLWLLWSEVMQGKPHRI